MDSTVDSRYMASGLNAMARAHRVNSMAGHLGAAVVAGCFIAEQRPHLDAEVYRGLEGELDRIIGGESVFSPGEDAAVTAGEMFEPFAGQHAGACPIGSIAAALDTNIDGTRQSGHNVIFASIAIRAVSDHPGLATQPVVDGIGRLIAAFDGASPGSGYYGRNQGRVDGSRVTIPEDARIPQYTDLGAMAAVVLDELLQHAAERRIGYGGLWHVINHAAALAELARYGYEDLAVRGLAAHHHHVQLWRTLPDVAGELGPVVAASQDPFTAAFWRSGSIRRDSALLTHRVKTLYGFQALAQLVGDASLRRQAFDRLLYLM